MKINAIIAGLCLSFALTPAFAAEPVDVPVPRAAEQIPAQIVVHLFADETAVVRVPTCGGCGYQWVITGGETELLSQIKKGRENFPASLVEVKSDLPLIGETTVSTFAFPKMNPGQHVFLLAYVGPGGKTALTREILLDVKANDELWK
jgi:hypothetical protein